MISASMIKEHFVGDFQDNKVTGKGTKTWGEATQWAGDMYFGGWLDGRMTDTGIYVWANGDVYRWRHLSDTD